jgi:hypothetical protein
MFSALVLVAVILCGAVFALSAKYNDLAAEHTKLYSAYEQCVAGTP